MKVAEPNSESGKNLTACRLYSAVPKDRVNNLEKTVMKMSSQESIIAQTA